MRTTLISLFVMGAMKLALDGVPNLPEHAGSLLAMICGLVTAICLVAFNQYQHLRRMQRRRARKLERHPAPSVNQIRACQPDPGLSTDRAGEWTDDDDRAFGRAFAEGEARSAMHELTERVAAHAEALGDLRGRVDRFTDVVTESSAKVADVVPWHERHTQSHHKLAERIAALEVRGGKPAGGLDVVYPGMRLGIDWAGPGGPSYTVLTIWGEDDDGDLSKLWEGRCDALRDRDDEISHLGPLGDGARLVRVLQRSLRRVDLGHTGIDVTLRFADAARAGDVCELLARLTGVTRFPSTPGCPANTDDGLCQLGMGHKGDHLGEVIVRCEARSDGTGEPSRRCVLADGHDGLHADERSFTYAGGV